MLQKGCLGYLTTHATGKWSYCRLKNTFKTRCDKISEWQHVSRNALDVLVQLPTALELADRMLQHLVRIISWSCSTCVAGLELHTKPVNGEGAHDPGISWDTVLRRFCSYDNINRHRRDVRLQWLRRNDIVQMYLWYLFHYLYIYMGSTNLTALPAAGLQLPVGPAERLPHSITAGNLCILQEVTSL